MSEMAAVEALQAQLAEQAKELARLRTELASYHKRMEEQVRQSEEKASDLIRYAPTGIYEVDFRTGRFRSINDAMCAILGYTREELLEMSAFDLLDDAGRVLFADRIRRTLAGENVDPAVEYRVKKRDGSVIYGVLNTRITYSDGQPDGAFVIAHDVTERRLAAELLEQKVAERTAELTRANEELSQTEAALRHQARVLANINDAVIATDPDGHITYLNQAAERQYGWQAKEAMGRDPVELFRAEFTGTTPDGFRQHMYAEGRWQGEAVVYRKDGTYFYADATSEMLYDENGNQVGAIGVHHDTSARKQLEEALRAGQEQAQAYSRRLVAAVENEQRSLARELHDQAGQSLAALKLSLAHLRREVDARGGTTARFEQMGQLIDGLMDDLRRLAMNLRPVSLDRYGLAVALQQYVEFYGKQSGLHVDLVTVGIEERRLSAEVETAIYRVVQESLTNVLRHARAQHVGVMLERQAGRVLAIIEDDGLGFDVDEALRRERLGLLGMRERVEMLGGSLNIESTPGKGSTIYAVAPVTD